MFTPPNESLRGNAGHSSQPSGGSPGRGAMPTGDRFNVANAEMPQPAAAVSPGKGAIPVEPGQGGGGAMRSTGPGPIPSACSRCRGCGCRGAEHMTGADVKDRLIRAISDGWEIPPERIRPAVLDRLHRIATSSKDPDDVIAAFRA